VKRIFLDTNIVLDILLQRDLFYADAAAIWLKIESNELEGLVSLQSLGTIFYLLRKSTDTPTARKALQTMCRVLEIADSPARAGHMALQSTQPDFEDALQYAIAVLAKAECLITRNASDFPKRGKIPVLSPEEFLRNRDNPIYGENFLKKPAE
jgi:predicted nucleic acid-binding protein